MVNPQVKHPGTLGFMAVAESDPAQRVPVSSYHVLVRLMGEPGVQDEPIFQPSHQGPGSEVAFVELSRADASLDCAAARVAGNIARGNPDGAEWAEGIAIHQALRALRLRM